MSNAINLTIAQGGPVLGKKGDLALSVGQDGTFLELFKLIEMNGLDSLQGFISTQKSTESVPINADGIANNLKALGLASDQVIEMLQNESGSSTKHISTFDILNNRLIDTKIIEENDKIENLSIKNSSEIEAFSSLIRDLIEASIKSQPSITGVNNNYQIQIENLVNELDKSGGDPQLVSSVMRYFSVNEEISNELIKISFDFHKLNLVEIQKNSPVNLTKVIISEPDENKNETISTVMSINFQDEKITLRSFSLDETKSSINLVKGMLDILPNSREERFEVLLPVKKPDLFVVEISGSSIPTEMLELEAHFSEDNRFSILKNTLKNDALAKVSRADHSLGVVIIDQSKSDYNFEQKNYQIVFNEIKNDISDASLFNKLVTDENANKLSSLILINKMLGKSAEAKLNISKKLSVYEKNNKVMEAILPVLDKMQLFSNSSGSKKSLFVSTADVLSLRGTDKTFMSYPIKNNLLSVYSANETEMTSFLENLAPKNKDSVFAGELSASSDEPAKLGQVSQLDTLNNKLRSSGIEILNPKDFANINSRLNILEAQFNSRLAAIALDQALEANEPIELNLEPQSFGKIKVTAMFEKSGLDVRLLSDNNAALSILRSSEAILSQILEQNGVKLANYSAEMSFGGNSNDGSSNQNASQHNKGPLSEELITNDQKRNDENDVDDTHLLDMLA